ncbi:MAG: hypothetical protein Q7S79_02220 [bacterium]|nr:hypothetical protein [bacterium]
MKLTFNSLYLLVCGIFLLYLTLPAPPFPQKPYESLQSVEEWDTESPFKRGYMTNFSRKQVIDLYYNQMNMVGKVALPTIRLNYPPEDAQTLIRDQTRSSYLEEFVHPFRESLFVNGYIPEKDVYEIWYRGLKFDQKVVIKYSLSNLYTRSILFIIAAGVFYFILLELISVTKALFKEWVLTRLHG